MTKKPKLDKEIENWMNMISSRTRVEIEIIRKIWLDHEEEAKNNRLYENLNNEEMMNYLKAIVISDIAKILPPPPTTLITFMPIGFYPRRMSRFRNKHVPYCDVMGWGKIEDGGVELCILNARGTDNMLKVEGIVPYLTYETVILFDSQKKNAGIIQGSMHQNTVFDSNIVNPSYLPNTIPERQKFIIEHIMKQQPTVKLAEAGKHLSRFTTPPIRDITDLRIIQVIITEVRTGRQENGKEWCVLGVTDGSFIPSLEHKAFNVWCDPVLILKTDVKKGSYVKIIGTIEFDCLGKYPQMTACSIIPETIGSALPAQSLLLPL